MTSLAGHFLWPGPAPDFLPADSLLTTMSSLLALWSMGCSQRQENKTLWVPYARLPLNLQSRGPPMWPSREGGVLRRLYVFVASRIRMIKCLSTTLGIFMSFYLSPDQSDTRNKFFLTLWKVKLKVSYFNHPSLVEAGFTNPLPSPHNFLSVPASPTEKQSHQSLFHSCTTWTMKTQAPCRDEKVPAPAI